MAVKAATFIAVVLMAVRWNTSPPASGIRSACASTTSATCSRSTTDPDSRPPCRLLHIVPGGDYGYRFRNGRKGTHPFTAWNGELPGTLPMVAGTGEAPSGILSYQGNNLPADYRDTLLGTSWGDHRIEQFRLSPRGFSYSSLMKPIVQGGENFRPVDLVTAPDGSLYFSDWVDKSYNLHKLGRIWRLSAKQPTTPRPWQWHGPAGTQETYRPRGAAGHPRARASQERGAAARRRGQRRSFRTARRAAGDA